MDNTKTLRIWDNKFNAGFRKQNIDKIIDVVKESDDLLFHIRGSYINVYYLGTEILKYSNTAFRFNKDYFSGKIPTEFQKGIKDFETWHKNLPIMKDAIYKRNFGGKKKELEKAAQQRIIQKVNSNRESEYYILDMEFVRSGCPFGRFDMIAVKKEPDENCKHKVAIIELKYGKESFKTSYSIEKALKNVNPYGSGIVGHAYNLNSFIYGAKGESKSATEQRLLSLAEELASMSGVFHEKKLHPSPFLPKLDKSIIDVHDIRAWLLCVACDDSAIESVLKYLGYHLKPSKYCARSIVPNLDFCYKVTDKEDVNSLIEKDFLKPYTK